VIERIGARLHHYDGMPDPEDDENVNIMNKKKIDQINLKHLMNVREKKAPCCKKPHSLLSGITEP